MHPRIRKELRLSIELFSIAIMLLLFSIILLSSYFDKIKTTKLVALGSFNWSITLPYSLYVSLALSIISAVVSFFFVFLMFKPEDAERLGKWVQDSKTRLNRFVFGFYLIIIWMALGITTLEGIVSTSNKLPDATWRSAGFLVGVAIYFIGSGKIIHTMYKRPMQMIAANKFEVGDRVKVLDKPGWPDGGYKIANWEGKIVKIIKNPKGYVIMKADTTGYKMMFHEKELKKI